MYSVTYHSAAPCPPVPPNVPLPFEQQTCVTAAITAWRLLLSEKLKVIARVPRDGVCDAQRLMNASSLVCWKLCMFVYYVCDGDQNGKDTFFDEPMEL